MRVVYMTILAVLLCACNNDIFVEDFTPDISELSMDGADDVCTITFGSDDWNWLYVTDEHGHVYESTTVIPAGGEPSEGKSLEGDGVISIKNALTDMTVTRRGRRVTVDVDYAIGNGNMHLWLRARSDEMNESQDVYVTIQRVEGLEIADVKYTLNSWGVRPEESHEWPLAGYACTGSEAVTYVPAIDGMNSRYKMSVATVDDTYLSALEGELMPIPTRTNTIWCDWELRGEMVKVSNYWSDTRLEHFPPLPDKITVEPGTMAVLYAEMEPCIFDAQVTVRNKFTGAEHTMVVLVDVVQPEKYIVIRDEI